MMMNKARIGLSILLLSSTYSTLHAAGGHAADDELALAAAQILSTSTPGAASAVTAQATLVDPADCINVGSWGGVINWTPHIPVSAANLPDGRILTFASNQRTSFPVGPEFTYAATWDPVTGVFQEFNNGAHDMFCGGITLMTDGRVMVNGGRNEVASTSIFDWRTNSWTRIQNMTGGRWYNTSVSLANGNVFTATGSGTGANTTERWSTTGWTNLTGISWPTVMGADAGYFKHWHPFLSVAPDGRLLHFGPTDTMHWFNVTGTGSSVNANAAVPGAHYPKEGCFVMYDEGKVLVAGGGTNTTSSPSDGSIGISSKAAYTVNMATNPPTVTTTGSMQFARQFANTVVLPSGEVLVMGGNSPGVKFSDAGSILPCEIWNPRTGTWRTVASIGVPRNYHSLALLMPDGRVLSAGGGLGGGDHRDGQLYSPPCFFTNTGALATRPVLSAAPTKIGPGMAFNVTGTSGLAKFALIRMAALTHSVNTDQRYLSLPFTETTAGNYQLTAHTNLNVMTPGYWMLFGIQPSGAFSVSKIIQVDASITVTLTNPGNQSSVVINPVSLQIISSSPTGTTFGATGLPTGLGISPTTGVISGTPTATGTFNVTLTANGIASSPFVWTILPQVTLNPVAATPPGASGAALSYTASSTGGLNVRYKWSWGDGTADSALSSSAFASHVFASPGRYQITLTATDSTGRITTFTFYQAIYAPITARQPTASSSIIFEDRPTGTNDRIWCVNQDNNSVSVFDAVTRARLAETTVGTAPRSLALAPDGRVWVTNIESSSVSILSGSNYTVAQTIALARGARPFGIAFDPDGTDGWIACEGTGQLLRLNPTSGAQIAALNIGSDARHVSVSADSTRVFVTRFITSKLPGESTAIISTSATTGGEVFSVITSTLSIEKKTILQHSERADTLTTGRGIPNYLGPAIISPDGLTAWVPSKQDNIKRGMLRDGQQLTHDQTVRSIASRIALTSGSPASTDDSLNRVDFDNAGIASNGAFDSKGIYLFTALEGSREVGVVDVWNKREVRRFTAGRAPQGIAVSPDGRTVFVQNFMDRTITVHDVGALIDGKDTVPTVTATLNCITTEGLTANVLLGKKHFYDSADRRIAFEQYISCASCHNDGGQDGRVWDFTGFGEGLRNNISLKGHGTHGPAHWTGNFDEIQDFEGQLRGLAGGIGLMADADFNAATRSQPLGTPKAGISADLDALAAFVTSLTTAGNSPAVATADVTAGQTLFKAQNCAACHSGTRFTNSALNVFANIGTIKAISGKRLNGTLTGFDVPTLRGTWNTAPYLHDGSANTLTEAISAHQGLTLTTLQLNQLAAYVSQIDDSVTAVPAPLQIVLATASTTVNGPFGVTGTLSETATGFVVSDISVTGGTISGFTLTGTTFGFNVAPTAAAVQISLPASTMTDSLGVPNLASNALSVTNNTTVTQTIKIEAEDFDQGAEGVAYHDTDTVNVGYTYRTNTGVDIELSEDSDGTPSIGWTDPGEWLRFTKTLTAGNYTIRARAASAFVGPSRIRIVINGVTATTFSVGDTTGWNTWQTFTQTGVILSATSSVRVEFVDGNVNLNWLEFINTNATPDTTKPDVALATTSTNVGAPFTVTATFSEPVTGVALNDFTVTNGSASNLSGSGTTYSALITPTANGIVTVTMPAAAASDASGNTSTAANTLSVTYTLTVAVTTRLQAEDFNQGAEGVAYHDTDTVNVGNTYRLNTGVDIENSEDTDATPSIGWTSPGEWLHYTTTLTPGTYDLSLRCGTAFAGPLGVRLLINGILVSTFNITNTGDWNIWRTFTTTGVAITTNGTSTIRIEFQDGDVNLNWIEFKKTASAAAGSAIAKATLPAQTTVLTSALTISNNTASITHTIGSDNPSWTLESTTDLKTWIPLDLTPVVTATTHSWPLPDVPVGIIRLKVGTQTTAPVGWQHLTLHAGIQTVGLNFTHAPIFTGTIESLATLSLDPTKRHYLEVLSGPHAGHRFDLIDATHIDTASANNTLPQPPATLAGATIAVIPHRTLKQAFPKGSLRATTTPDTADQVIFFVNGSYQPHWLSTSGWTSESGLSSDDLIIPPGTGLLFKSALTTARRLTLSGSVRTTPFAVRLSEGNQLLTHPWPLTASPQILGMLTGFISSTSRFSADSIQLWNGDTTPNSTTYTGLWFMKNAITANSTWVFNIDPTKNQNTASIIPAGRAFYFKPAPGATRPQWIIPAP